MRFLLFAWFLALAACGGGNVQGETAPLAVTVETLSTGTFAGRYDFLRIKISREGTRATYGLWFPPPGLGAGQQGPAVLLSNPYAGVDWTGDSIDTDARRRAGTDDFVMLPDLHGPPYRDGAPLFVPYHYSPIDGAGGAALAYLANGVGVLMVYQRVYAGGDLQDDIDDTLSGLAFMHQEAQVDRRRVAAWGSSYGAGILLHAMAQAPAALHPASAAALTPIVDFERFVSYADWQAATHLDTGQAILRLQPFASRARAAAARPGNTSGLSLYGSASLLKNGSTKMMFVHDLLDTIAPLLDVNELYFGTPGRHQVFIYPHEGVALDWSRVEIAHTPITPGYDNASGVLFSQAYLLLRLQPDMQIVRLPRFGEVEAVFPYLRQEQLRGANLNTYLRPRLLELCDPRLTLVRYEDNFQSTESGREFVARMLRTYWGYAVNADSVVRFLTDRGL